MGVLKLPHPGKRRPLRSISSLQEIVARRAIGKSSALPRRLPWLVLPLSLRCCLTGGRLSSTSQPSHSSHRRCPIPLSPQRARNVPGQPSRTRCQRTISPGTSPECQTCRTVGTSFCLQASENWVVIDDRSSTSNSHCDAHVHPLPHIFRSMLFRKCLSRRKKSPGARREGPCRH